MPDTPTPARKPIPRPPAYDDAVLARLAEAVYRDLLGPGDAASMIAKDKDDGAKLRKRALIYVPNVRAVLDALTAEAAAVQS